MSNNGNREYKSDVFAMLLEDKKYALNIYNAVNGSDYQDEDLVEINTIEGRTSLSVRNDASFIIGSDINIYEHQSTFCPNMPLRCLFYFADIIWDYTRDSNIYGSTVVSIPAPKFVIFYNGTSNTPLVYDMKLSDSYINKEESPNLELVCRVYNINYGNNSELVNHCKTISDYAYFVSLVKKYYLEQTSESSSKKIKTEALTCALKKAINQCIEENILRDFFTKRGQEVLRAMYFGHTWEERLALAEKDARKEGQEEGRERVNLLGNLMYAAGRTEEFMNSLSNVELQRQLFIEFGISTR